MEDLQVVVEQEEGGNRLSAIRPIMLFDTDLIINVLLVVAV